MIKCRNFVFLVKLYAISHRDEAIMSLLEIRTLVLEYSVRGLLAAFSFTFTFYFYWGFMLKRIVTAQYCLDSCLPIACHI